MTSSEEKSLDLLWGRIIAERDGPCCKKCGSTWQVTSAHIVPRRHRKTRHDPRNGTRLCGDCHYRYDKHYPEEVRWMKGYCGKELWEELQAAKKGYVRDRCYKEIVSFLTKKAQEMKAA